MNDLENQLRSALRAKTDGVTAMMLRTDATPTAPRTGVEVIQLRPAPPIARRRRRRWLSTVGSVAAAVIVVLTAALIVGNRPVRSIGPTHSRDSIPWSQVGDGWTLITLNASKGRETLDLLSPTGTRYSITTLPDTTQLFLSGWERDRTRALLSVITPFKPGKTIIVVDLRTGKQTSIPVSKDNDQRFAGPDNHLIVNSGPFNAQTVSDTGAPGITFTGSGFHGSAVSPDGSQVAFGAGGGGVAIYDVTAPKALRALTPPAGYGSCAVSTWSTNSGLLATCYTRQRVSVIRNFIFSPTGEQPPKAFTRPDGSRLIRFTGGDLAIKQADSAEEEPRRSQFARVNPDGTVVALTLPAQLGQAGWLIVATTSTDLLLTRTIPTGADPGPIVDLARWNPLAGAFTVVQHLGGGQELLSYLAWNSYFAG